MGVCSHEDSPWIPLLVQCHLMSSEVQGQSHLSARITVRGGKYPAGTSPVAEWGEMIPLFHQGHTNGVPGCWEAGKSRFFLNMHMHRAEDQPLKQPLSQQGSLSPARGGYWGSHFLMIPVQDEPIPAAISIIPKTHHCLPGGSLSGSSKHPQGQAWSKV